MSGTEAHRQMGLHAAKNTPAERSALDDLLAAFEQSPLSLAQRLQAFARHVRRQDIARLLCKYELFKLALPCHGSVVECGVFTGAGLLGWLQFSAILDPYNDTRRIIGFDTFAGFPGLDEHDTHTGASEHLHAQAFATHSGIQQELENLVAIHDRNRPLGHIPKVELVAGDACQTIPAYLQRSPHLLISLVYLDIDLFAPTRAALEHLLPRVVSGGLVAFDELNCAEFPGETAALLDVLPQSVALRRFPLDPYISYFVKP